MIEEMSFKYLLYVFWTVLPRNVFRNPIKSLWWSIFAKIVKNFQPLTVFLQKSSIIDVQVDSKQALGNIV